MTSLLPPRVFRLYDSRIKDEPGAFYKETKYTTPLPHTPKSRNNKEPLCKCREYSGDSAWKDVYIQILFHPIIINGK